MVYAMATVDVGEVRGDLATCEPLGRWCSEADSGASPHLRRGTLLEEHDHQLEKVKMSSRLQAIELLLALWPYHQTCSTTAAR